MIFLIMLNFLKRKKTEEKKSPEMDSLILESLKVIQNSNLAITKTLETIAQINTPAILSNTTKETEEVKEITEVKKSNVKNYKAKAVNLVKSKGTDWFFKIEGLTPDEIVKVVNGMKGTKVATVGNTTTVFTPHGNRKMIGRIVGLYNRGKPEEERLTVGEVM